MAATVASAAVVFPSSPNYLVDRARNGVLFLHKLTSVTDCRNSPFSSSSSAISKVFISCFPYKRRRRSPYAKPFSPVMEWQDSTVKMEIDVPVSVAYNCYSDREAIPCWMPFISSVKPIRNQKIHWRSLEGLPNRPCNHFLKAYLYAVWKGLQKPTLQSRHHDF